MLRSMYTGVLGLQAHQVRMDVIGNNLANVNTAGYKATRVTFQDVFAQTLRSSSAPDSGKGGTNPIQIGLGSALSSAEVDMGQGIVQMTGRETDFAIQGGGFFILSDEGQRYYTRAGGFNQDAQGYLVNPNGWRLQGWMADNDGVLPERNVDNLTDLRIQIGAPGLAKPTSFIRFGQTLDASAAVGEQITIPATIFDSLGESHMVYIRFTKLADNQWSVEASMDKVNYTQVTTNLQFNPDGSLNTTAPAVTSADWSIASGLSGGAQTPQVVTLDFANLTQTALDGGSTVVVDGWDGLPSGVLESFAVGKDGVITGMYSNGDQRVLGQFALATFANPEGLAKVGSSAWVPSANSGPEQVGAPETSGRGSLVQSSLEGSNVDMAYEFTNMIITQRGYQANSRIITASDEMLQDLTRMMR